MAVTSIADSEVTVDDTIESIESLKLLSVAEVAKKLGIGKQRVRALLGEKKLHGQHVGTVWVVTLGEVHRFKRLHRPSGRPRLHDRASQAYGAGAFRSKTD